MKILKELEVGDVFLVKSGSKYVVRDLYEDGIVVTNKNLAENRQILFFNEEYLDLIYCNKIKPLTPAQEAAKEKLEAAGFKVSR